ncbi:MAG: hypothetical protein Q9181_004424 [Wetmoreana brouardii]
MSCLRPSGKGLQTPAISLTIIHTQEHTLQKLNIQFRLLPWNDSHSNAPPTAVLIAELLETSVSVESVDLDFTASTAFGFAHLHLERARTLICDFWNDYDIADVTEIFQRVWWPRLREFRVLNRGLFGDTFTSFMKRHSSTLESLFACKLEMAGSKGHIGDGNNDSNWQPVFEIIAPIMSTKTVDITYVTDDIQRSNNERTIDVLMANGQMVFDRAQYKALQRWEDYGRRVSDYLRRGGSGSYPTWSDEFEVD